MCVAHFHKQVVARLGNIVIYCLKINKGVDAVFQRMWTKLPAQAAYIILLLNAIAGPEAQKVLQTWRSLEVQVPPYNWRAPPTAGFQGCSGLRLAASDPWRPVRSSLQELSPYCAFSGALPCLL